MYYAPRPDRLPEFGHGARLHYIDPEYLYPEVGDPGAHVRWSGLLSASESLPADARTLLDASATDGRDAYGDDFIRQSNGEALLRDYPDAPWVRISYVNVDQLTLDVTDYVPGQDEFLDDLVSVLVGLADDYVLYDEELHSQMEQAEQDRIVRQDGPWDVRRGAEDSDAADSVTDDAIVEALFQAISDHPYYGDFDGDYFRCWDDLCATARQSLGL